jgi:hypothetical protein
LWGDFRIQFRVCIIKGPLVWEEIENVQTALKLTVKILYVPLITQQLAAWAGVGLVN